MRLAVGLDNYDISRPLVIGQTVTFLLLFVFLLLLLFVCNYAIFKWVGNPYI